MNRLTPEREAEILEIIRRHYAMVPAVHAEELWAELERLRAEQRATLILPSEVGSDGKCPGCAKHIEDTNPTHIMGCSVFARRAEQRIPPFVYYVGGVSREPLRHRVLWGYFHDEQRALEAAHNNETDINEAGYYPLALVAKVREGLAELPEAQWWFEFDGTHYNRIETPEWTKRYGWLGFPTAAALKRPRGLPDLEQRIPPGMTAEKLGNLALLIDLSCDGSDKVVSEIREWAERVTTHVVDAIREHFKQPEQKETIPGLPKGMRIKALEYRRVFIDGYNSHGEYVAELEPIAPEGEQAKEPQK